LFLTTHLACSLFMPKTDVLPIVGSQDLNSCAFLFQPLSFYQSFFLAPYLEIDLDAITVCCLVGHLFERILSIRTPREALKNQRIEEISAGF
jgi:hypothetical protein